MLYALNTRILRRIANLRIAMGFAIVVGMLFSSQAYSQSSTLSKVLNRGAVACGVNEGLKGFAQANSLGKYSGLDADFCRAIASAVFNDPEAVEFVALSSKNRFEVLTSGEIDLLARNTTWTIFRNVEYGEFVGVNYYDGQGFMVPKVSGVRSALELDNKGICVIKDTTTELNAIDFFSVSKMRYKPIYFESNADITKAYEDGRCAAMTTDRSALAATRATLSKPDAHLVLPEIISKEPLGPMVRSGDSQWANIVRWSLNCMINAEEMGVNSGNVSKLSKSADPARARLLGTSYEFGILMGVSNQWCATLLRTLVTTPNLMIATLVKTQHLGCPVVLIAYGQTVVCCMRRQFVNSGIPVTVEYCAATSLPHAKRIGPTNSVRVAGIGLLLLGAL